MPIQFAKRHPASPTILYDHQQSALATNSTKSRQPQHYQNLPRAHVLYMVLQKLVDNKHLPALSITGTCIVLLAPAFPLPRLVTRSSKKINRRSLAMPCAACRAALRARLIGAWESGMPKCRKQPYTVKPHKLVPVFDYQHLSACVHSAHLSSHWLAAGACWSLGRQ